MWSSWGLLALTGAAVLLTLALAWRLSRGPIDVTRLTRLALPWFDPPAGLSIDRVRIGWSNAANAVGLTVSVGTVSIAGDDGTVRDRLDDVDARFAPSALLRLHAMPASLRVGAARIALVREKGGAVVADGLHSDRGEMAPDARNTAAWTDRLPALQIDRLDVMLRDVSHGLTVAVEGGRASAAPGFKGAELRLPVRLPGADFTMVARFVSVAGGRVLDLDATPFAPRHLPLIGPSIPFDGPIGLALQVEMQSDFRPRAMQAVFTLGGGRFAAQSDTLGLLGGRIALAWKAGPSVTTIGSGRLSLEDGELRLAAPGAPDGVRLQVRGELAGDFLGAGGGLTGNLRLSTGRLGFPQLRAVWPVHAAYWARVWVAANLSTGSVTGADFVLGLVSRRGLAGLDLASAHGSLGVSGATLRWLAPIEPATGVSGTVTLVDEKDLSIRTTAGRAHGLDIAGTTMTIDGLTGATQNAVIGARLAGPVGDLVWILSQKRLHVDASGSGVDLQGATGTVDGSVRVSLPLIDRVRMDEIGIAAHARFDRLHLDRVALGRSIDDGVFTLDATQGGLSLEGQARFAEFPVSAALGLDFRAGPGDATAETATVSASLDGATIGRLAPTRVLRVSGAVPVRLRYRADHDRRATLALDADLGPAAIATGFGWSKSAGAAGVAGGTLVLDKGRLASIRDVRINAPGLVIEAHGAAAGGRFGTVSLDRIEVGRTRASGTISLPPRDGGTIRARVHGATLDLVPLLAPARAGAARPRKATPSTPTGTSDPAPDHAAPSWSLEAGFAKVELAHDLSVTGVSAVVSGGGGGLAGGTVTAAGPSPMDATLVSGPRTRHVVLHAGDTGALLRGLGVTSRLSGGALSLEADLERGSGPLAVQGKANLRNFRIVRTPLAARLLRDATIYGLADRAGRGDLTVDRLEVPFTVAGDVLHIDGLHAWQLALGITASGTIGLGDGAVEIDGTVIPAYAVNTLPGRLPLIGRLFSPERGGGLFAAKYRIDGDLDHPRIRFDALAALVPGALRQLVPP